MRGSVYTRQHLDGSSSTISTYNVHSDSDIRQVLPKVTWEVCVAIPPPHWRMHSPAACASCTMHSLRNRYGTLWKRYGSVTERYEALWSRYRILWSHCGTLRSVVGRYGTLRKPYRTLQSFLTLLVRWQEGHPTCKNTERWGAGIVICLGRGADLHMAQLMPLPLTESCFSKILIGLTFLVPAHLGNPGKSPEGCKTGVCVLRVKFPKALILGE